MNKLYFTMSLCFYFYTFFVVQKFIDDVMLFAGECKTKVMNLFSEMAGSIMPAKLQT